MTIALRKLVFFSYHGLYPEEQLTGNEFEVNLSVTYQPNSGTVTDLSDTINYVSLHTLVKEEMQRRRDLLETVAMEMAEKIHLAFPAVHQVDISITKLHPPIPAFTGTVGVSYSKEY